MRSGLVRLHGPDSVGFLEMKSEIIFRDQR